MQRKQSTWVAVTLLMAFFAGRTVCAQFALIDDFQSYELGEIDGQSDGSGTWFAGPSHLVDTEPNSSNRVLNAADASAETNAYIDDPNLTLEEGATGTLFFRVQRGTDVVGHIVYGLSDVPAPGAWGDYEAAVGDRSQQRAVENGTLEVRSGANYLPLDHDIEPNEWINLWMVVDNDFDTLQVYAQSDTTYPEQTLLDDDGGETTFDFRNGTSEPLSTFLLRTGVEHGGPFYLDDIYLDPGGRNLINPVADQEPFIPGDFNSDGAVDVADFNILADNFGQGTTFAEGDFNFSGSIDLRDFVAFRQAYEGQEQAAAVPEPAGICLTLMALLYFSRRAVLGRPTRLTPAG